MGHAFYKLVMLLISFFAKGGMPQAPAVVVLIKQTRALNHRMSASREPHGLVIEKIGDRYIASFITGRDIVFVWARTLEELKELLKHEFGIEIGEVRVGTNTYQPSPS